VLWIILGDEGAHFVSESGVFGGEIEVHRTGSLSAAPPGQARAWSKIRAILEGRGAIAS
jgi:hypothetical protein